MKDHASEQVHRPDVSVIVVSYNGREHLDECLGSLIRNSTSPATETVVVDNASSDDSVDIVRRLALSAPGLTLVESATNRGYAGAVTCALSHATGRYVAVLNQDMVVEDGWLVPLVRMLDAHPAVGAVSPMIVLYQDDQRINSLGQNVHVTGLGFNRWLGRPRQDAGHAPLRVSGLHGGAFVIRRSILDRLGGWDSSGFLYHEDVELSWLLHLLGYEIHCVPASAVKHKYHLTMHPEKLFLLERNRGVMLLCNLEWWSLLGLLPLLAATEILMLGYCLLRGRGFLAAKRRAIASVLGRRRAISERRAWIRSIRQRHDWQVLRQLKWHYVWNQFVTLGKETGHERRR